MNSSMLMRVATAMVASCDLLMTSVARCWTRQAGGLLGEQFAHSDAEAGQRRAALDKVVAGEHLRRRVG